MIKDYVEKFGPHLGDSRRWECFLFIADHLLKKNKPLNIIETGCARTPNNWHGDGQSTLQWDFLANQTGGKVITIDLSEHSCKVAKDLTSEKTTVICADSINALLNDPSVKFTLPNCDMLFLDSYDHNPPYGLSELHHAGELAACYDKLPSGCLIVVDDCNSDDSGKHFLVKKFFDRMGIPEALKAYVSVWIKP